MQLLTVSRSEAEKVYIVIYNAEGAELTQGEVVEWTATTTAACARCCSPVSCPPCSRNGAAR